jgi:hypothetical protein
MNNELIISLLQSALAALNQNKTYPADIKLAKQRIEEAIKVLRES